MTDELRHPIDLFLNLLNTWRHEVFPSPSPETAESLNAMWRMLARALAGSQVSHVTEAPLGAFHQELRAKQRTPEAGMPPGNAIRQRMQALVVGGMDEMFLAVALRQSLDTLIGIQFPQALPTWQRLADEVLPARWQWSFWNPEAQSTSGPHATLQGRHFPKE